MSRLLLVVTFVACSSTARSPSPEAHMPRCSQVAAHIVGMLDARTRAEWVKEMRDDGMYPEGVAEKPAIEKLLTRGCEEYDWPDDVRRCAMAQPTYTAFLEKCEKQAWWYAAER
jgi:hypothetical protein